MGIIMRNSEPTSRSPESVGSNQPASVSSSGTKYKTEFCNCYAEFGRCDYGDRCQFAHSTEEFQHRRKSNVKDVKLCTDFITQGYCPYGRRCNFSHQSPDGLVCDTTQPILFGEDSHAERSIVAEYNRFLRESRQDDSPSRIVIAHQVKEGSCSIKFSDTYMETEMAIHSSSDTHSAKLTMRPGLPNDRQ